MRRRLFKFAAGVSAFLCVALLALWVRTEVAPQIDFYTITPTRSYGIGTECGAMIGWLQQDRPAYQSDDPDDVQLRAAGFRYLRISSKGMRRWNLVLPFWLLASAAAALPLGWGIRRMRDRRRRSSGRCVACGYDLRASPERCPECGMAAKGK